MKIDSEHFRASEGKKIKLERWPTTIKPFFESKDDYRKILGEHTKQLSELQNRLYASGSYSLLLIFQAMDTGGKDGAIKHVMSGLNPEGCQVTSFKQPTAEELNHDFLWRAACHLPERGWIGIFNRSHYEETLIVRVHPAILRGQHLPDLGQDKHIWRDRFHSILDFEAHLHRNGTRIVKFFLHLSKEEQRRRFLARIDQPGKNWKFNQADVTEREFWKQYMKAYEECIETTTTNSSPWYIIPADDKKNARLIISQVTIDSLAALHLSYPKVSLARRKELRVIRARLT